MEMNTKFVHPHDITCQHPRLTFELFVQTDRDLRTYGYDGEDFYDDEVSVKTLGYYNFTHHEQYEGLVTGVVGPEVSLGANVRDIPLAVWQMMAGQRWVSHNAPYDASRHARLIELGLVPDIWPSEWVCTMNMTCFLTQGVRSLADCVKHVLGEDISKDTRSVLKGYRWVDIMRSRGVFVPTMAESKARRDKKLKQNRTGQDILDFGDTKSLKDQTIEYVISDADKTLRLYHAQAAQMPEKERILSAMTIYQGLVGFAFDPAEVRRQLQALGKALWKVKQRLPWVSRWNLVPLSTEGLARICQENGVRPPKSLSKDDEDLREWLEEYEETYTWVASMKLYRELNDALQLLDRIEARAMPNGRSQFTLKYAGAGATARWAGDGGMNLQALRKGTFAITTDSEVIYPEDEERARAFRVRAEGLGAIVIDLRGAIRPRPGYKIVTADLEQIEPRAQAWYAGNWDLLEDARKGISCYISHARTTMGIDRPMKKTDELYKLAKMRVLSLGYGAGWKKFYDILAKFHLLPLLDIGPELTEQDFVGWAAFADKYQPEAYQLALTDPVRHRRSVRAWITVEDFRHATPASNRLNKRNGRYYSAASDLQRTLQEQMEACVGRDFVLPLASGRNLVYHIVHPTPDGWVGGVGLKQKHLYSGLLFENLIQAISRDIFCDILIRLLDMGIHVLFTVHDECVLEVPIDFDIQIVKDAFEQVVPYMPYLPISTEIAELDRYAK